MEAHGLTSGMKSSTELLPTRTGENYVKKLQRLKASENGFKSKSEKEITIQENLWKIQ